MQRRPYLKDARPKRRGHSFQTRLTAVNDQQTSLAEDLRQKPSHAFRKCPPGIALLKKRLRLRKRGPADAVCHHAHMRRDRIRNYIMADREVCNTRLW